MNTQSSPKDNCYGICSFIIYIYNFRFNLIVVHNRRISDQGSNQRKDEGIEQGNGRKDPGLPAEADKQAPGTASKASEFQQCGLRRKPAG